MYLWLKSLNDWLKNVHRRGYRGGTMGGGMHIEIWTDIPVLLQFLLKKCIISHSPMPWILQYLFCKSHLFTINSFIIYHKYIHVYYLHMVIAFYIIVNILNRELMILMITSRIISTSKDPCGDGIERTSPSNWH